MGRARGLNGACGSWISGKSSQGEWILTQPGGFPAPGKNQPCSRAGNTLQIAEIGVFDLEKAYVLLTIEMGSGKEVLNALDKIPDVKEVYRIHGIYDFIIYIEAETLQELKDLIDNRIKGIRKIRSTLQLICVK